MLLRQVISRKKLVIFIIAFILCAVTILPISAISSSSYNSQQAVNLPVDDANENCVPVDLVIAIDQSSSMMPTTETNSPSDPNDFRSEAAQLLITELLVNQLLECPEASHRWSVIEFGGEKRILQQMTPFGVSTDDIETGKIETYVEEHIQSILPVITEDDMPNQDSRSLQKTDFGLPFQEAVDNQFLRTVDYNNQEVSKVLVVITDGAPCADSSLYGCYPDNYQMSKQDRTIYMDELYTYWQDNFDGDIDLYLIPINTRAQYLEFSTNTSQFQFNTIEDYWEAMTGGRIFRVQGTGRTVTKAVTDVSRQMLGRTEAIDLDCMGSQGKFFMPPYQQQAEIIALKENYEDTFSLNFTLPDGQIITVQDGNLVDPQPLVSETISETIGHLNLGRSEIYRIIPPVPGEWGFNVTDCGRIFVRFSPVYIEADDVSPKGTINVFPDPPYYDTQSPSLFQVTLGGNDPETVLQSLFNTPIDIALYVWHESKDEGIDENGEIIIPQEARSITLHRVEDVNEDQIIFQSQPDDYVLTPQSGEYHMLMQGRFSAPDIQNPSQLNEYKIFDDVLRSFIAKDLSEFQVQVLAPTDGTHWQFNQITEDSNISHPLDVEVALVLPDGTDFPYDSAGIDTSFKVSLQQGDNPPVPVDLQPIDQNEHFVAQLNPPDLTQLQIGTNYPYILTVEFTGTYDDKTYYFNQDEQIVSLTASVASGIQPSLEPINSDEIYTEFLASCPVISDWSIVKAQTHEPPDMDISATVYIQVRHGDDDEIASIEELEHMVDGNIGDYLTGRLLRLDGTVIQEDLHFVQQENKFVLSEPLQGVSEPNEYTFEVMLKPDGSLADDFSIIATSATTTFHREDTGFTTPTQCKQTMSVTGIILFTLVILFVWEITGPLKGTLILTLNTGQSRNFRLPRLWFIRRGTRREFHFKLGDEAPDVAGVIVETEKDENGKATLFEIDILDSNKDSLGSDLISKIGADNNKFGFLYGEIEYKR